MKTKGIYFLYRTLQAFALPVLLVYWLWRSVADPAYFSSLRERLGFLPRSLKQTVSGAIWLHAVSVGEILSLLELAHRLRSEFPHARLFVSAATLAGRAMADEKLAGVAAAVFYAPVDYVFAVRRALRLLRPGVVVVAETEIWPNLFREVKRAGAGLLIVNGRISDRTAPRYRRLRWFFRHVLRWPDTMLVQSDLIRERYLAMGAPAERVRLGGNLKYDVQLRQAPPDSAIRQFLERVRPAEVWIAASTMPPLTSGDVDEDDAVIAAFRQLAGHHPGLLLVLAPRRPERFEVVRDKLERAAIPFVQRSALQEALPLPGVLLVDSIGELSGLFFAGDVVFMGGTLAARGGHNILEPAFFARPIVCGPHMENFREIAEEFRAHQASVEIREAAELAGAVSALLADGERAAALGKRALACAEARRGATARALEEIQTAQANSWPSFRPPLALFALLWPFSRLWRWGSAWKRRRDRRRQRRLDTPVISVGNITLGGTGKTPFVIHLAEQMKRSGHKPGILSRGYGRPSRDRLLILEPGARVRTAQSGDEPQIFLRAAVAPVGIGADRFETGRLLAQRFAVDVLILDDGFQHLLLERQVDVVLIDVLDPFGGGEVFPLGRLREPLPALGRADVLVITRSEQGRALAGLERRLREYNPRAPIFSARVAPEYWVEQATGRRFPPAGLPFARVAAFCALGNPESFWRTLRSLGIRVVDTVEFGDHHHYRPHDLRRLVEQFRAAGAEAVLTTEKDIVNLEEECQELLAPLPFCWLKIGTEIDREAEFLEAIERQFALK